MLQKNTSQKFTVIIPARSGSKRVPDKNIRSLDGKPLLVYSIITTKYLKNIEDVYVSTDSKVYGGIAQKWGAKVIMRSKEASTDDADMLLVIQDTLQHIPQLQITEEQAIIIILLPTTPFRTPTLIQKAIDIFVEAGDNATSLRGVEEMTESAWKCFEIKYGTFLLPFAKNMNEANRSNQLVPKTYRGNGYIEIVKVSQVLKDDLWGDRCIGFVTPKVIEIDCEDDFRYAEWWIKNRMTREEVIFR